MEHHEQNLPRAERRDSRPWQVLSRAWRDRPYAVAVTVAVLLAALSLLVPASPGYDPWAWIVWGREVARLELSMESGPSFKPLPVALTTLFSFFGDAAPHLWLVVARAGGLVAVVASFRLAARLADAAKLLAGIVAALGIVLIDGFVLGMGAGWSEFLLAAFLLVAVERHLDGARRTALVLVFAASLIRVETWPFLALYAIHVWRRDRASRLLVAVLVALVPMLWLGPDLLTTGDPLRSQMRAQRPLPGRPALAEHPVLEVLRQGSELVLLPLLVLAAAASVLAVVAYARHRAQAATAALELASIGWIGLVAVMSELGYTGNPRYLLPAAAFVCVLAGVGAASLLTLAERAALRRWNRPRAAVVARAAVAGALLVAFVPAAVPMVERIRADLDGLRARHAVAVDLDDAIAGAGGRDRVLACGDVFTGPFEFPLVAWTLDVHMRDLSTRTSPPGIDLRVRPARPVPPFELTAQTARWDVFAACEP